MTDHRIIVSLVTWNSAAYLEPLFASLRAQTEQSLELLITDNASTDDTVVLLSDAIANLPFPVTFFREKENTGFAKAHNHHIREAIRRKARFFFVVNPDCVIEPHAIALLVQALESHDRAGSAGGKILRAQFLTENGLTTLQKLSTIDSTGLLMTRARQWKERGHGEEDRGQYTEGPTLGVTGAFALYRVRALVDTAFKQEGKREFFDEDFFSYKEDIDLAWRLQLFGWSAWYTPHAIAWHHRMFGRTRRRFVAPWLRALSWRNHFFLLIKNDDFRPWYSLILIFLRECAKFFWIIFLEPAPLPRLLPSIIRLWGTMRIKRQWIMQHRRQDRRAMLQTFRLFRLSSSITKPRDS